MIGLKIPEIWVLVSTNSHHVYPKLFTNKKDAQERADSLGLHEISPAFIDN